MVKVAINGFGRIGRLALRKLMEQTDKFEVVAINDLTDAKTLAHLFKYDSAQGRFNGEIEVKEGAFVVNGKEIKVTAETDAEILVQCTKNDADFAGKLYKPEDAPWGYSCVGKFGNVAKRRVNTILDHDIAPYSNMVLGEVLNDKGNWSGYLPHRHPQPETYYFKFDRPEGFGASFVGNQVFKSTDGSFSAIPGGELHPQAVAPGFQMYTCWMIRHIDGNPWLQTDRCEDERYTWLHDAEI